MPYHRPDASFEERVAAGVAMLRVEIVVLAIAVAGAMGLGAYGFVQAQDATHQAAATAKAEVRLARQQSRQALAQAKQAKATTKAIVQQRDSSILGLCHDQNRRHHNTIAYIHSFGVTAARRRHISLRAEEASLEPFVLLMNAAIPHQNCRQVLAQNTTR